jgi:putative transposase
MQNLGRCYVRYINQTYQRTRTLWESRFESILVDTERCLLILYRYIELNPVRARMVEHLAAYLWSNYQSLSLLLLSENTIQTFRDAKNKVWAIDDEPFIEQVSNTLFRRAKPSR